MAENASTKMATPQTKNTGDNNEPVDQREELKAWLEENEMTYKNLIRDFSDCVLIAQLIKKLYPKSIDLHNYQPGNGFNIKYHNWLTLNTKVLPKLNLQQPKSVLEKFAKSTPGYVDQFLCNLMNAYKSSKQKEEVYDKETQKVWTENDEIISINVSKKVGDAIIQIPQKMILYSLYEELTRTLKKKDSCILAAEQKITHLENIVKLKAERIEELSGQLVKVAMRNLIGGDSKGEPHTELKTKDKSKQNLECITVRSDNSKPSVSNLLPRINSSTYTTTTPCSTSTTNLNQGKKKALRKSAAQSSLIGSGGPTQNANKSAINSSFTPTFYRYFNPRRGHINNRVDDEPVRAPAATPVTLEQSQHTQRKGRNISLIPTNINRHRSQAPKSQTTSPDKRPHSTPRTSHPSQ